MVNALSANIGFLLILNRLAKTKHLTLQIRLLCQNLEDPILRKHYR